MDGSDRINVAVVGLGYWGPHYGRIITELHDTHLRWCCDRDPSRLELLNGRYPWARSTTSLDEVLGDEEVDAVVVATPTKTHADLVCAALEAGKDVLVEKPLASALDECDQIERAIGDNVLMVGHTFAYNPGIRALRGLIKDNELGQVRYVNSVRAGLGPIRQDVNVLWDLGPHDVAIMLELIRARPATVRADGQAWLREDLADVVFVTVRFEDGTLGHLHLSWIDPYKTRKTIVVGDQRMAVFDDVAVDERLKILDRGAGYEGPSEETRGKAYGEFRAVLREGNIIIPRIPSVEPLAEQLKEFAAAARARRAPYSGFPEGREVVAVLQAAQESLDVGGIPVPLTETVLAPTSN